MFNAVKINSSSLIDFNISNDYQCTASILDVKIRVIHQDEFLIHGISKGAEITEKRLQFRGVFTPRSIGDKKVTLMIQTETS